MCLFPAVFLILTICLALTGCKAVSEEERKASGSGSLSGGDQKLSGKPVRVVSLQASLSDIWLSVGGTLIGVTDDLEEHGLTADGAKVIGSTKSPNAELIVSLSPDLVLYTPDVAGQAKAAELLEECGIKTLALKEDDLDQYLENLKTLSELAGNEKAYDEQGLDVLKKTEEICEKARKKLDEEQKAPSVLFIRAYSSGYKVKAKEHIVCSMLDALGAVNIASYDEAILENLSLEIVLKEDPDFILISFMGEDEESAKKNLDETLFSSPVWQQLSAVKQGRLIYLPRELFHYKPNRRWAESYEYLYELLYETEN